MFGEKPDTQPCLHLHPCDLASAHIRAAAESTEPALNRQTLGSVCCTSKEFGTIDASMAWRVAPRTFLGMSGKVLTTSQSCLTPYTRASAPPTARYRPLWSNVTADAPVPACVTGPCQAEGFG